MEFGMFRRIKPREKYVRFSMKEIWRNLDGPQKNKKLRSYVVSFEFSRPKRMANLDKLEGFITLPFGSFSTKCVVSFSFISPL